MSHLTNCNYFTKILFVIIITLLLSPCYSLEYEEVYPYETNHSQQTLRKLDRFPDGTVLIVDVVKKQLSISLLHPNRSDDKKCNIDEIM